MGGGRAERTRRFPLTYVARRAGVSYTTASRALNGSCAVRPANRSRVLTAATQLGYCPDLASQTVARGTSASLALVTTDLADAQVGQVLSAVAQAATENLVLTHAVVTGRAETDAGPNKQWHLVG